jgi:hypothetical protein
MQLDVAFGVTKVVDCRTRFTRFSISSKSRTSDSASVYKMHEIE